MVVQAARKAASNFIDMLLPPRCIVTGDLVPEQGVLSPKAWAGINFISEPFCAHCGFPFDYEVERGLKCTSCVQHEPPFISHRSAVLYTEESRSLILGFKHGDQTQAVDVFVPWLLRAGRDILSEVDIIAPVPLHYTRLLARRYNQAALMVQGLSQHTNATICLDLLKRVKATQTQGYLSAKERFKNVKRAFALSEHYKNEIKGKRILLIDDVYTTGATIKECSKALLKAGAGDVYALTLARVVRDQFKA